MISVQLMNTSGICIAKDQDIGCDAIVSQFNGFINGCYCKMMNAVFLKTGGHGICVMTIGIRFDDRHDF